MIISPVTGHNVQVNRFLAAASSKRFHHAWLFEGPKGIGKASLAKNLAAHLLGAECDLSETTLGVKPGDVVAHLNAGSHPDFRILQKDVPEGEKPRQDIPVGEMRSLLEFFTLKPAMGGYRVAIIDALDELNPSGANALLKTLEEPPPRCVLILIYHGQSGLLPTIRSRCQPLRFQRLPEAVTAEIVSNVSEGECPPDVLHLANGAPGTALQYLDAKTDTLMKTLVTMRDTSWPRLSAHLVNRILKESSVSTTHLDLFIHFIDDWFKSKIAEEPNPMIASKMAKTWQNMQMEVGKTANLNLELSERSARCLNHLQTLSRELETRLVV